MRFSKIKRILPAALAAAILVTGCSNIKQDAVLIDVNSGADSITLGYGNFVARYTQAMYDQVYSTYYGTDMWQQDLFGTGMVMEETVKKEVVDSMEEDYILSKHMEEYGVTIPEEKETAIAKAAADFMAANSKDALKEMGATEEYVKQFLRDDTVRSLMEDAIKKEAAVEISDEEANQKAISYIYLSTKDTYDDDGNAVSLTDEEKEALKKQGEELVASEAIEADAESAGLSMTTANFGPADIKKAEEDPDNYYGLALDVMKAADALEEEGDRADLVYVEDDGYYVIRLDSLSDKDATDAKKESMKSEAEDEYYDKKLEEFKAAYTFTLNEEEWAKVRFINFFERAAEETEAETETETVTE